MEKKRTPQKKNPRGTQKKKGYEHIFLDLFPSLLTMAREGNTYEEMAKRVGCSTTTFYEHLNRHPNKAEELKFAKLHGYGELENVLFQKATGKFKSSKKITEKVILPDGSERVQQKIEESMVHSDTALIFALKNRVSHRWNEKPEISKEEIQLAITETMQMAMASMAAFPSHDNIEEPVKSADVPSGEK